MHEIIAADRHLFKEVYCVSKHKHFIKLSEISHEKIFAFKLH